MLTNAALLVPSSPQPSLLMEACAASSP
jgi:hypothetical protein